MSGREVFEFGIDLGPSSEPTSTEPKVKMKQLCQHLYYKPQLKLKASYSKITFISRLIGLDFFAHFFLFLSLTRKFILKTSKLSANSVIQIHYSKHSIILPYFLSKNCEIINLASLILTN